MPIYTYKCFNCNYVEDKLCLDEEDTIQEYKCPNCNKSILKKIPAPSNFQLKGDGWFNPSPSLSDVSSYSKKDLDKIENRKPSNKNKKKKKEILKNLKK